MRVVLSNVNSDGTGKLGAETLTLEAGVLSQGTKVKWLFWKTGIEYYKVDGQVPKAPFWYWKDVLQGTRIIDKGENDKCCV